MTPRTRPEVQTPPDLPLLAPYTTAPRLTCPNGHDYPATAGECPQELHQTPLQRVRVSSFAVAATSTPLTGGGVVSPEIQAFITRFVAWKDNGQAPRSNYTYDKWDYAKAGVVNHIPVCHTLEQLTAYFNGGAAQGSTHFGNGRDHAGDIEMYGYRFPCSQVHQYMTTSGPYAPWAQGIIARSAACPIPQAPILADMNVQSGEPNPMFISIENVAMSGADGVTDAQFNSNVCLRAYGAEYYLFPVTPYTQLWHAEIDQQNRCFDPGWPGALEDEMQAAAVALVAGDASRMRQAVAVTPPPEPEPTPPPDDPLAYFNVYQGMQSKLGTGFWHPDPATRTEALSALYADLGKLMPP